MKRFSALLLAIIMTLSLCACGSTKAETDMAPAEMAVSAGAYYDGAYYEEAASAEAYYESGAGFAAANTASEKSADASDTPEENPAKIIYSADVTVETRDFDSALAAVEQLVKDYGGWIESSSINGANYDSISRGYYRSRSAYYTLRIPSGKFNEVMNSFSTLGNVPYTHTYTENVTAQYYDVEARLKAYEAQEARLIEMMDKAESVEDIITIEEKLTEVRYTIDSLQSSLKNWDRQVSYSTVSLSLEEVREYTPEQVTNISFGRELWLSFTGAVKNMGSFLKDLLKFIVSALPTLTLLAICFFVFRPLLRKLAAKCKECCARRKEKKALRKAEKDKAKAEKAEKE